MCTFEHATANRFLVLGPSADCPAFGPAPGCCMSEAICIIVVGLSSHL